jgi:chemotaxis-related protein WspD
MARSSSSIAPPDWKLSVMSDMHSNSDTQSPPQTASFTDCWNLIGVHGDRSCPQLPAHTHCRNCSVYSAAARQLLDRPLLAGDSDLWTRHHAQPVQPPSGELRSCTLFQVCGERFALATQRCVRVANMRTIHRLPHRRSAAVLGVANIHGELMVCVSFAVLLKLNIAQRPAVRKDARFLVTDWNDGPIAFEVDELQSVEKVAAADLKALPATVAQLKSRCTHAVLSIKGHSVGVLDEGLLEEALRQNLA